MITSLRNLNICSKRQETDYGKSGKRDKDQLKSAISNKMDPKALLDGNGNLVGRQKRAESKVDGVDFTYSFLNDILNTGTEVKEQASALKLVF